MKRSRAAHSPAIHRLGRSVGWVFILLAALSVWINDSALAPAKSAPKPADAKSPNVGRLIRIPLPITDSTDIQVKRLVQRAVADMTAKGGQPVLIFELLPTQNRFGEGSDFSRSMALARYLTGRELSAVKTVAYIPQPIKGHAVLVAMACKEIIMAPDAEIGEAGVDEPAGEPIDLAVRNGYQQIADLHKTIPASVALGMLDKQLEVYGVETETTRAFVLGADLDEYKKSHTLLQPPELIKPAGSLARFDGHRARALNFAMYLAADRAAVAKALQLPLDALDEDPTLGGEWRARGVRLKGPINAKSVARAQRMIEDLVNNQDVNFICLWLNSPGGSRTDSMTMANYLADLDPGKIRTVAYIPEEARGDAALIALGCDQIVLARDAVLGGSGAQALSPDDAQLIRQTYRDSLGPKKSRSWSLPMALIDPDVQVYRYTHRKSGRVEFFTEEEAKAQADADDWNRGEQVTHGGAPLRVQGAQAVEFGLARHVVQDFNEFKQVYGLENELRAEEPNWADLFIDALTMRGVEWLLLLIGGAALYAELQAPGIGLGGFIAGVCFLLYFWSKHLDGTAGWLEVLLFLAGVSCILLEIFVLPGSAIFGLGGGLLVIVSLVLASQTFVFPRNDYQLEQLRNSLLAVSTAGAGVIVVAFLMRRYLPHTPMFSHMVLEPPTNEENETLAQREALVDFEDLLGHHGYTTTQLTPSGKARIRNRLVDVIADGEVIGRGVEVEVVEVQGNRIVVRTAEQEQA